MGRPLALKQRSRPAPDDAALSRRAFFTRSSAAVAALAAATAQAEDRGTGQAPERRGTDVFAHGVASGDPDHDSVILWTRVTPRRAGLDMPVIWWVSSDRQMRRIVDFGFTRTGPDRDYTVKVEAKRLEPGRTYYYRFHSVGAWSPVGRTRTLPSGSTRRLRLAFASCSNHAAGYFNAYRQIARRADLDAVLHLGDYLYEYGPGVFGNVREPDPPFEMVSLSDYRRRHAQYKADRDAQELHRQHPMIVIWDDHEITNDTWRDGAENHTEGAEGTYTARVADGLKAYYEWMPVRVVDRNDPRRSQRAFRFGDLVDLVMLEERLTARSQQLPTTIPVPGLGNGFVQAGPFTDPTRTLLGAEQESWLANRLRQSRAQWKLIGQGVMFAHLKLVAAPLAAGGGVFVNSDQWDGYQPARDRIYDIFKGTATQPPVNNCVVLTGDIHSSWANDLTQDPNNPVVAAGGYDPATGEGSRAVEFVATSITSPGLADPTGGTAAFLRSVNPHMKFIDFNQRGYCLLDVTPERMVCEWWFVDTVASVSEVHTFGTAFEVRAGTNRLAPSAMTTPRSDAPALAPAS
jgi:alkaline phosphatase D